MTKYIMRSNLREGGLIWTSSIVAGKARGQDQQAAEHVVSVVGKQTSGQEVGYALKPQGPAVVTHFLHQVSSANNFAVFHCRATT